MIVLTTAVNYGQEEVEPFLRTLKDTGYDGNIIAVCNNCDAMHYLKSEGVSIVQDTDNGFDINSRRFFTYKEILRGVEEPVILTDVRDVIFQSDPRHNMPLDGINVFCEHNAKTIGTCPYNSSWMQTIFGEIRYAGEQIICAGVTSGLLTEYVTVVWDMLKDLPPIRGLDQAIHNHIVRSGRLDATIYTNDVSPVFTVGYIPYNTVPITDGMLQTNYGTPCIIHQYDRHPNLLEGLKWLRQRG